MNGQEYAVWVDKKIYIHFTKICEDLLQNVKTLFRRFFAVNLNRKTKLG